MSGGAMYVGGQGRTSTSHCGGFPIFFPTTLMGFVFFCTCALLETNAAVNLITNVNATISFYVRYCNYH